MIKSVSSSSFTLQHRESKLQKALDAANKLIAELKAKVESLTRELSEYKSARGKLYASGLEQENKASPGLIAPNQ